MNFGFVRGKGFTETNNKGKIVTSRDGYNSYLIIVDSFTRYTWVLLSASKDPPLEIVQTFLDRNGLKEGTFRNIRCDQGGELARSSKFRSVIQQCGYSIEPTGADNSSQNGIAKRPNQTFGNMMRAMMLNAGLGPEFWSYAITQAVFVKNRLPHARHEYRKTPFEAFTGRRPNIKDIKVFGSRVVAKNPGSRNAKLDDNTSTGIFLHHTATTGISKYLDDHAGREKTTSHLQYDEAHFTTINKPMGAEALMRIGMKQNNKADVHTVEVTDDNTAANNTSNLIVKRLSNKAIIPTRATEGSAGLDLYGTKDILIQPGEIVLIPTDIAISCPINTYSRIAPRSGLTIKRKLDIRAGVVDRDYRGNIMVAMQNIGEAAQHIKEGDKIAQLILEQIVAVNVTEEHQLDETKRNTDGFRSTGDKHETLSPTQDIPTADVVPYESDEVTPAARRMKQIDITSCEKIILSDCPFGSTIQMEIHMKGDHPTLGMQMDDRNMSGRVTLLHCQKGNPANNMKKWKSTLRNSHIIEVNNIPVSSISEIEQIIRQSKLQHKSAISCTFATEERVTIHPSLGTPQLYFDQLNVIAKHLYEIDTGDDTILESDHIHPSIFHVKKKKGKSLTKLTKGALKKRDDWQEWNNSEMKQLDNYETQDMFEAPIRRPPKANVLNLLWTYLIKSDGTKKARCVCNGSPKSKETVTLAHTFAACLEQPGARTFWAAVALLNMIVVGADASNAFAEAPSPKSTVIRRGGPTVQRMVEIKRQG